MYFFYFFFINSMVDDSKNNENYMNMSIKVMTYLNKL